MSPRPRKKVRRSVPTTPVIAAPVPSAPDMVSSYRWVWYLLSLFVPFAGILVALFLYDRDEKEVRRVGRNCLLIGFVFWVLIPLFIGFLVLVYAILSMAGWISDVVDTGN